MVETETAEPDAVYKGKPAGRSDGLHGTVAALGKGSYKVDGLN